MNKFTDFYFAVMSDDVKKAELAEILDGKNISSADDDQLKRIGLVAEKMGYKFDLNSVREFLNGEMDDDELDAVAGGKNETTVLRVTYDVCQIGGSVG